MTQRHITGGNDTKAHYWRKWHKGTLLEVMTQRHITGGNDTKAHYWRKWHKGTLLEEMTQRHITGGNDTKAHHRTWHRHNTAGNDIKTYYLGKWHKDTLLKMTQRHTTWGDDRDTLLESGDDTKALLLASGIDSLEMCILPKESDCDWPSVTVVWIQHVTSRGCNSRTSECLPSWRTGQGLQEDTFGLIKH